MARLKVGIIDYGLGNLLSLTRAIIHLNADPIIVKYPEEIQSMDILILPGVGAFPDGMEMLKKNYLPEAINSFLKTGRYFMGICLGMQMMLSKGYEHNETEGLGLIEGSVKPLPNNLSIKVPNINWHEIFQPSGISWENSILNSTNQGTSFYFVHSFYAEPTNKNNILAETNFGQFKFASAIHRDNIFGTQFHPEKSGIHGLKILETFLQL